MSTHTHTYVYNCIYIYMYVHIYIYIIYCTLIYIYICIHLYNLIYIYTHAQGYFEDLYFSICDGHKEVAPGSVKNRMGDKKLRRPTALWIALSAPYLPTTTSTQLPSNGPDRFCTSNVD